MPNEPPRRSSRSRSFNPRSPSGLPNHAKHQEALAEEGEALAAHRLALYGRSLSTAALRRLPSAQDAVEIQAYILRREGYHYADIAKFLEVGHALARTLVAEGAAICVDEDPGTSLRLHLGRLESLIAEWLPHAFAQPASVADQEQAHRFGLPNPEVIATQQAAHYMGQVLKILAMQQDLGTWLATLPRRGQERKDEDDHAEIKAILLRADDYGPPPGEMGAPHGLPSMPEWRPGNVEEGEEAL